jgi:hypothetical protein
MQLPVLQPDGEKGGGGRAGGTPVSGEVLSVVLDEIHRQVRGALLYTHHRADTNTDALREAAASLYAVIDLLIDRGVIDRAAFDERRRTFLDRISAQFKERGMGAIRLVPEIDKYTYENNGRVNCLERLHVCRAACCRLNFALSRQDIKEGVVQWDLTRPYTVQHGPDGFCVHRESGSCTCGVYEKRPVACRAYDCHEDDRIWKDFEKMELSDDLVEAYRELDAAAE